MNEYGKILYEVMFNIFNNKCIKSIDLWIKILRI